MLDFVEFSHHYRDITDNDSNPSSQQHHVSFKRLVGFITKTKTYQQDILLYTHYIMVMQ